MPTKITYRDTTLCGDWFGDKILPNYDQNIAKNSINEELEGRC